MKRNDKKGFTIIELVVVIAVIAILAAVLIPTFSSIIKKANTSADIQAVNTMNKYLAIEEVTGNKTIVDVYDALKEGGMTAKDYHPLTSDTYFFWDSALNRIVYTDESYNIIYPENSGAVKANGWFSLSGEIKETPVDKDNAGVYNIDTAEKLYWVANQVNDKKITGNVKINITASEIDLMGANVTFCINYEHMGVSSFELNGADDGTTIKNLAQLTATTNWEGYDFAAGLVSRLYLNGSATIKNITIKDSVVGDINVVKGCVGALVGEVMGQANKTSITNCHINNTVVSGAYYVGGLIGQVQNAKVNISNCSLKSVTANCTTHASGKCIGAIYAEAQVTLDKKFSEWVDNNCTLNLVKGNTNYAWYTPTEYKTINNAYPNATTDTTTVVKTTSGNYWMFCDKAYATVLYTKYNVNDESGRTVVKYGDTMYYVNTDSSDKATESTYQKKYGTANAYVTIPYSFITE